VLSLRCTKLLSLTLAAALASASVAAADTLDFESLVNGEAGPFVFVEPSATVTVTADIPPPGNHIGLAAFDSTSGGVNSTGGDPDLLVDSGMIMIVQNNNYPVQTTPGIFDTPNDDEMGGQFFFDFSQNVTLLTLDLIDINGDGMTVVTLTDTSNRTRTYNVPDDFTGDIDQGDVGIGPLDLTTLLSQNGVGPGNPAATVSQDLGFNANQVISMSVTFNGSAGIDNVTFVPEPSTGLLVAMGLFGLASNRLRRR
jgi:hypothetical protein